MSEAGWAVSILATIVVMFAAWEIWKEDGRD